jgi:uncharacterized protein with gpF-like domain
MDFSADLVTNIGQELRAKINNQIRLAVLAERSPMDAMKAITVDLGLARKVRGRDIVKGVNYRAEMVVRTEMGRVFNLANHAQQQLEAEEEPGMLKAWEAAADRRTRDTHLAAHVRYMNNPIPIDEPFVVGGHKMMYPLDPAGPPQETINCRCRAQTIHPLIGRIASPLDARIEKEKKRRGR